MVSGIMLGICIILIVVMQLLVKHINNVKVKKEFIKFHKIVGVMIPIGAVIHLLLTFKLRFQRPISMIALGFILLAASCVCLFSYVYRSRLKKWALIHKISAVILIVCLVIHSAIGLGSLNSYKKSILNINNNNVEISKIADGEYIGEEDVGYIYAKISVKVKNGRIDDIKILEHRTERGKPAELIVNQIVEKQSVKVDTVTGATNSSKVIMKAVENALK